MKRLLILFLLCALSVPVVARAERVFGISPAKIEKTILIQTSEQVHATISRSEAVGEDVFEIEVDPSLQELVSLPDGNRVMFKDAMTSVKVPLLLSATGVQEARDVSGTIRFVYVPNGNSGPGMHIRYAIGMRLTVHVVTEPTLAMRAQRAEELPPGSLVPATLRVERDQKTDTYDLVAEIQNTGTSPVKDIPIRFVVKRKGIERTVMTHVSSLMDAGGVALARARFPMQEPGMYEISVSVFEETRTESYVHLFWSQWFVWSAAGLFLSGLGGFVFTFVQKRKRKNGSVNA